MHSEPILDSSAARPVAFFDFDDTLVFADSMLHWQRWYTRRRKLWHLTPWVWFAVLSRALGRPPVWMKRAYMATANRESTESLQNLVRQFSREFLSQCGLAEILDRAWMHHYLGHEIVIITASPDFYLQNLNDLLPPHRLVATPLRFTGKHIWNMPVIEGRNTKGAEKLLALADLGYELPRAGTFGYSDHVSDIPLLESVEFALAVRPDEELAKHARQQGWPILRPVLPFGHERTRWFKALWLLFGSWGPRWPFTSIPQGKRRRSLWKQFCAHLEAAWKAASMDNHQEFGVQCEQLERVATRLKGAAPRLARALVQKPLIKLGHSSQPGLDRIWATGQSVGLAPEVLDALQRMVFQAPDCSAARLVMASVWSDGLFQVYRVERPSGFDRVFKLLLPGIETALQLDLKPGVVDPPNHVDAQLERAWAGLMSELRPSLERETDLAREVTVSERLRALFPDLSQGILIPHTVHVREGDLQGLVMEAIDGYPLPACFGYLRETRRLRDPRQQPTPDYTAFAALITTSGTLPTGREISQRLWKLLSTSWFKTSTWLTLSGTEDVRILPARDGQDWRLSMSDFAGVVEFPEWCAHALREWDVVCPEGSADLEELCRAMGWSQEQIQKFRGRWRELIEVIWHPVLRGCEANGFAFEDWRLDGRLTALLGANHSHENWPIPGPVRRVFRTLWWLRRNLAGLGSEA